MFSKMKCFVFHFLPGKNISDKKTIAKWQKNKKKRKKKSEDRRCVKILFY